MIINRKKKSLTAKSNIINSKKWFSTLDQDYVYTYLEHKTTNRALKDEIVNEMKQSGLNSFIFTKKITLKTTGEAIKTYIIAAAYNEFVEVYSHINCKRTAAIFSL